MPRPAAAVNSEHVRYFPTNQIEYRMAFGIDWAAGWKRTRAVRVRGPDLNGEMEDGR